MFYKFKDTILEELYSLYTDYSNDIIEIHLCDEDYTIDDRVKQIVKDKDFGYIVRLGNESFHRKEQKIFVENIIQDYRDLGYKMILSTSSIKPSQYELHPLVNLHFHWKELEQRRDLTWKVSDSIIAFPSERYDYKKELEFDKSIKSILSVRKESDYRRYLFENVSKDNNSILRYADYAFGVWTETEKDIEKSKNFPTWYELLDEYNNSIFAFIYETEHTTDSTMDCQISEKTIKAMLSGCIPIVIGQYNFQSHLKDMGLYIGNSDFGFKDSTDFKERLDSFIDCYNLVKKFTFQQCKEIWLDKKPMIQQNYDIISNLLYRDFYKESREYKK